MKTLSWPTAIVAVAALALVFGLAWIGHVGAAAATGAISLIATAVLPALLGTNTQQPPAPPAEKVQS